MRGNADLDPYEIAFLCGGRERIAMTALVGMVQDGQIRISADRQRVHAVRRAPRDPIESAALQAIPEVGRVLGLTMLMIAASDVVGQVGQKLRADGLMPNSRLSALWQWGRVKRARNLRRGLVRVSASEGLSRVAAVGAEGIADDELRQIFETHVHEPPVTIKLTNPKLPRTHDPLPEAPDRSGALYYMGSDMGAF